MTRFCIHSYLIRYLNCPNVRALIITDQTMTGLTGLQLARELLKIRPDIPIILCARHSETVSPERILEVGVKELLMKPLTKHEFAEAVRRVLDDSKNFTEQHHFPWQ